MTITWEDIISAEEKEERRLVHKFPSGISVHRQNRSLIVIPPSKYWRALSSGNYNGGFISSPTAIFNTTSLGGKAEYDMMGEPEEVHNDYSIKCAMSIDLDPNSVIGLGTAAHMDNAALGSYDCNGIEVSTAITAGIRGNGGRVGDPATYDEMKKYTSYNGTIVIILMMDADLSDSALIGSMMTATEAKSHVIKKLMARSLYSNGVATGSGTDQVTIICNKNSRKKIEFYRNDSDLAKTIKKCVEHTLEEAFDKQTMMNSSTQCDPYVMLSRYNITEKSCRDEIRYPFAMKTLIEARDLISKDSKIAALVSAVLHIMDEMEWELVPKKEGIDSCRTIISTMFSGPSIKDPVLKKRFDHTNTPLEMLRLTMAMILYDKAEELLS